MKPLMLHFLGTGGGRFVMTTQRRRTAGIRINYGATKAHIDPGPGALVFSNWAHLSPTSLDAVIITHCHPDHYNDAEVFIEAMTRGTTQKRGILAATPSVLRGNKEIGPSISKYHLGKPDEVIELIAGTTFQINELSFKAMESRHSDPDAVGLRFEVPELGSLAYTGDTGYFTGLAEQYKGVRVLIACTMWPRDNPINMHLCTDDVLRLLRETEPRCAILTHFGMRILNTGPENEAVYLEEETGIPVIAAKDGMTVLIEERIEFQGPRKGDKPRILDV